MYSIFLNTFREIIRSKYFSLIFLFGIILFVVIFFLNTLALDNPDFIVVDFGLSFIELSGLFVILFLGNRLLSREFEEKTIYLTLSRPIKRWKIIIGKFLWFASILALTTFIQSIFFLGLCLFLNAEINILVFVSLFAIFLKHITLLALILFFSIFLSGGITTFLILAFYIIGHSGYALLEYAKNNENFLIENVGNFILFFFPNFESINFKNLVHNIEIPNFVYFLQNISFIIIYILIIIFLANYCFEKKNFDSI